MTKISNRKLHAYRAETFRIQPGTRLHTQDEAIAFVNQRGYVYFWPITGVLLPSLWTAVAGDRPVADQHDDPGHVTWGWKDELLGKKCWYYAKILRKKATIISLDIIPYFYALSENYGAPEEDYLTLYEQGRLTQEAKSLYEALLDAGPLDTIALRRATHMSSPASEGRFNRALTDLQADFRILPVGVTEAGAWHYAFAYDAVHRHFPDLSDRAHDISETEACQKLASLYFNSVGAAQVHDLVRLFGWSHLQAGKTVAALVSQGVLRGGLVLEAQQGMRKPAEWFALPELTD